MHLCVLSSRTTHSSICCIWTLFICVCYHRNLSLHELNSKDLVITVKNEIWEYRLIGLVNNILYGRSLCDNIDVSSRLDDPTSKNLPMTSWVINPATAFWFVLDPSKLILLDSQSGGSHFMHCEVVVQEWDVGWLAFHSSHDCFVIIMVSQQEKCISLTSFLTFYILRWTVVISTTPVSVAKWRLWSSTLTAMPRLKEWCFVQGLFSISSQKKETISNMRWFEEVTWRWTLSWKKRANSRGTAAASGASGHTCSSSSREEWRR